MRIAAAFLAVVTLASRAEADVFLSLDPQQGFSFDSLIQGEVFTASVNATGFTPGQSIQGFILTSMLGDHFSVLSVAPGNAIPNPSAFTSTTSSTGFTINYGSTAITRDGSLAVVQLLAATPGQGFIGYSGSVTFPDNTNVRLDGLGRTYSIASASAVPIPEPSSLVLMAMGAVLIGVRARR